MDRLRRFLSNESGATAIEYCFIASLVSIAIFAGLTALGPKLNTKFVGVSNGLN